MYKYLQWTPAHMQSMWQKEQATPNRQALVHNLEADRLSLSNNTLTQAL